MSSRAAVSVVDVVEVERSNGGARSKLVGRQPRVSGYFAASPDRDRIAVVGAGPLASGDPVVDGGVGHAERVSAGELSDLVRAQERAEEGSSVGHSLSLASNSDSCKEVSLSRRRLAPARIDIMSKPTRLHRLKVHVAARLRAELEHAPRGAPSMLARRLGISTAHMTNIRSGKLLPGDELIDALERYWGTTRAALMTEATGETPPKSRESGMHEAPRHEQIDRAAEEHGYTSEEAQVASLMLRGLRRADAVTEEIALDLLMRARLALRDGQRSAADALAKPRAS